jgi:hypothetical protein
LPASTEGADVLGRTVTYRRNERNNWELVVEARAGDRVEFQACGDPILLEVDAIYRDPLSG